MNKKRGFTLIEVSLFLAITGVIFVGIVAGTQNSIFWHRYNDSIQSFAEFLRTVYSQVTSVQSNGDGSTEYAIYGRLVVFGVDDETNPTKNVITSYSVIGDADCKSAGEVEDCPNVRITDLLSSIGAHINETQGITVSYTPRWGSQIQTTAEWGGSYTLFRGALLVVRHPSSGIVYTLYTSNSNVIGAAEHGNSSIILNDFSSSPSDPVTGSLVDFCINPNGADESDLRKDIRILAGARNSSGIEIVPDDNSSCE